MSQHIETTTSTSISPSEAPVTTVSVSITQPALYVSSPIDPSPPESRAFTPTLPVWQPPSLEEFEEDIRRRRFQPVLQECRDPVALANFLGETGQQTDPMELVEARQMALDTTGLFAECTPRMAWNFCFGDREVFYAERRAQMRARNPFSEAPLASSRPLKRAAAKEAQDAPIRRSKPQNRKGKFLGDEGSLTIQEGQTIAEYLAIQAQREVELAQDAAIMVEATKKKRRCGTCHQEGHYSKTCQIGDEGSHTVQERQTVAGSSATGAQTDVELAQDAAMVAGVTKKRQCGTCHQEGHYSKTCQVRS